MTNTFCKIRHKPTGRFLKSLASKRWFQETIQRYPNKIDRAISSEGRIWKTRFSANYVCSIFNSVKDEFEVVEYELKEK